MASLATYAKLTPPAQFQPEEQVLFRLQYSQDLVFKYATLIIDGYTEQLEDGTVYDGYKSTHQISWATAGQWYTEYIIPSGTLGKSFPQGNGGNIIYSGKMQAKVEFGDTVGEDGHVVNPVFTSNVTLVDMIILRGMTVYFIHTPYMPNGSTFTVTPYCDGILNYGADGNEEVQSYRIFLYDSNYNLIQDSRELYDWDTNLYGGTKYVYHDLQDNTTYYVKCRVILNGGCILTSDYESIIVNYDNTPSASDNLTVSPQMGTMKLQLDLTGVDHTKVVFSRTVQNESDYLEIATVENPADIVTVIDKYPIPTRQYTYRATVYNGSLIAGTYYNNTLYKNNNITISDVEGSYSAVADITKHPINRNDRGNIIKTMDSKYPYNIINGSADYDSGQITGMFSTIKDDCTVEINNRALSSALRAWLNNGRAKLLTYYTGEAWIVAVNNISTTDPDNTDVYNTSFSWTAIGDARLPSEYVRLGLVIINE